MAEISPERQRGRLLSFIAINQVLGALVSDHSYLLEELTAGSLQAGTVVNLITRDYLFGWRISLSGQFVVGALLALGAIFLPRSPRYAAQKTHQSKI